MLLPIPRPVGIASQWAQLAPQPHPSRPACRKLPIRSDHSALNTLFQSAGAVSVKKATVILHQKMAAAGFVYGRDWLQLAHVHDEFQLALRPGVDVELVGRLAVSSIQEAGIYFNFRLPLDGEFKVGANWAETH